jgi:hypothetical protein
MLGRGATMTAPKFKKGDRVRCIKGTKQHEANAPGGSGWIEGVVFTVGSVTIYPTPIYWGDKDTEHLIRNCGVYEDWLELADEPHTGTPSGKGKLKAKMGRWYVPL